MTQNKHDEALAFLKTVRKNDVSVLESAVLLQALSGAHHTHRVTQRLHEQLKQLCTEEWIRTNPLATVFAVANALHFYDAHTLHGRHIGVLAQRLMGAEKTPGGPYAEPNTEPDVFTNSLIALFAAWAAGTLPGTHAFLRQTMHADLHSDIVPNFITQRYLVLLDGFQAIEVQQPPAIDSIFAAAALLWEPAMATESHSDDGTTEDAKILAFIAKEIAKLGAPLDQQGGEMLARIQQADKQHEITCLAQYFHETLHQTTEIDTTRLGIANVYCWMAYMAYDNILDDSKGSELLPLANIAHRKALSYYRASMPKGESLVAATFTRMDQANAWELEHARASVQNGVLTITRLPEYGNGQQLAARSFAHVLGPILIAMAAGQQLRSAPLQAIRTAFTHYLIARQLNDDAHDWQDDLAAGQLTFVVARLLRAHDITSGSVHLGEHLPALQQLFRESVSQEIATIMIAHCQKAKELFQQSELLKSDTMLDQLCDSLEESARRMISLSKNSEDLLSTF